VVVERQVVLLSRDAGLASTVERLLSNGDRIAHCNSMSELADWSTPEVAAVVLDSQPNARRLSYKQVRERYSGPLVMLLDKDERRPDLPPDGARQFLHRPFQVAELSTLLDAPMPQLGSLEAAIIAAWSRHATAEQPVLPTRDPSYRIGSWQPSLRRRARVWGATIVGLMSLLLAFSLSDQGGSCAPACTKFGGAIAGAAENQTPLSPTPSGGPAGGSAGGGSQGGQPPGSSAASSQPPTTTGGASLPVITGVGGLIESINPITSGDTTPPSGPEAVPGVPAPPGVSQPPGTSPPPGTTPPATTAPPTTAPPTTAPPTTEPPTTAPPTTEPPTTAPPTTEPPTTAPPTTEPPTTAPPTTEPPTTAPPTTTAETTAPPTTAGPTTAEPPAAPTT
jgi:hypothetical protein